MSNRSCVMAAAKSNIGEDLWEISCLEITKLTRSTAFVNINQLMEQDLKEPQRLRQNHSILVLIDIMSWTLPARIDLNFNYVTFPEQIMLFMFIFNS